MQGTADFHDQIADTDLPKAAGVVDDATALDTAVDMLDAHATACDASIRGLLRASEFASPGLASWHDDLDMVERKGQEAQILEQAATRRQWVRGRIRNPLVVGAAGIGVTEKEDRERRVDQQHIFHRVAFFLAAIIARLLSRVLGAPDAAFGAIVAKRGERGAAVGESDGVADRSGGTTRAAASALATPRRWANAVKDRVGASPSMRSVACRTTNRT